jgi:PleD family two-component response regulator
MADHILVLCDNKNHESILRKKLKDASLIFIASSSFAEEKLAHLRFAFIIIDETDAEKKTLTTIDIIKQHANTQAVPILVITGKLNRSYLEKLIHHGVSNFLSLPLADENIFQTLQETEAGQKAEEIISSLQMPIFDDEKDLSTHSVINQLSIGKIKQAFREKGRVALAIFAGTKKPELKDDLVMEVKSDLYCIISLKKNKKALLDDILQIKSKKNYAGIVSTEDHQYDDITLMIDHAKQALSRAKETPHGISFFVKG